MFITNYVNYFHSISEVFNAVNASFQLDFFILHHYMVIIMLFSSFSF